MTIGTSSFIDATDTHGIPLTTKTRDADHTRQLLLQSARLRFARDGYSSTTVRDIATDAGVNVALINRYFTSKEGLFEACLTRAVKVLGTPDAGERTVDQMLETVIRHVADSPSGEHSLQLLLLLRSSGDEGADLIRRNTLQYFAERMAAVAGWRPEDGPNHELVLRAQIAMAAALGMVLLRASSGIEPLTSATADDLALPLGDLLTTLLSPTQS